MTERYRRRWLPLLAALALAAWSPGISADEEAAGAPPPEEIARLVSQLADPSFETREAAQQALLKWGSVHPERTLALLPGETEDAEVRERCEALRQQIPLAGLRRRMPPKAGTDKKLKKAVEAVLDGPSPEAINALLTHVTQAGRGEEFAALWIWLLGNPETDARALAAGALGILGVKPAIPQLARLLEDPDADVRCRAAVALVALGETSMSFPFLKLLGDPAIDPMSMARTQAAIALVALRDPSVVPQLVELLESPDQEIMLHAALVLDALGEKEVAARFIGDAANGLPERSGSPGLVRLLEDPGVDLKVRAAMALRVLCDQSPVPTLLTLLKDPRAQVRLLAVAPLAELMKSGDKAAMPALEALREDPDDTVRAAAAEALKQAEEMPHGWSPVEPGPATILRPPP